jgi:hypothetical protein
VRTPSAMSGRLSMYCGKATFNISARLNQNPG